MNEIILIFSGALKDSIFNKDWSYHGAQVLAISNMYSEILKEYFWVFNLLLWGLKFYNEYVKARKSKKESDKKTKKDSEESKTTDGN